LFESIARDRSETPNHTAAGAAEPLFITGVEVDMSTRVIWLGLVVFAWDELGKDKRSTRVIQAYPCAAGETPATPPASTIERDTWPTTVAQAARTIVTMMDDESKARVKATKKEDLIQFHHGWGTGIRNELGLWRGNDKLLESCGNGTKVHPDSCSMVIIEAVWALLQAQK